MTSTSSTQWSNGATNEGGGWDPRHRTQARVTVTFPVATNTRAIRGVKTRRPFWGDPSHSHRSRHEALPDHEEVDQDDQPQDDTVRESPEGEHRKRPNIEHDRQHAN